MIFYLPALFPAQKDQQWSEAQRVIVDETRAGCPWKGGRHRCLVDLKGYTSCFHGMLSCETDDEAARLLLIEPCTQRSHKEVITENQSLCHHTVPIPLQRLNNKYSLLFSLFVQFSPVYLLFITLIFPPCLLNLFCYLQMAPKEYSARKKEPGREVPFLHVYGEKLLVCRNKYCRSCCKNLCIKESRRLDIRVHGRVISYYHVETMNVSGCVYYRGRGRMTAEDGEEHQHL